MADRQAFEDAVKSLLRPPRVEPDDVNIPWDEIQSLGKLIPTDEEFFADDGIRYQASYGNHHYKDLTIGQVKYLSRLAMEEE